VWRLAVKVVPPGDVYISGVSEALSAWWYTSPARQSGSMCVWQLVCSVRRYWWSKSALLVIGCAWSTSFGDVSEVGLLVLLELWLGMYPLSCGSGSGLSTWHSLSCGSEWHLLSCGLEWRMNTRNFWVVARVGECCRCECARCGVYG